MSRFAFGEAVHGFELARALVARGDRVLFLGPSSLKVLAHGAGVQFGDIDDAVHRIDEAVREVLREQRCASLVLVDATQVFLGLSVLGLERTFLDGIAVPVVALDLWNLPATDGQWDTGTRTFEIPAPARTVPRLLPVPFLHPEAGPTAYDALSARAAPRTALRDRLGIAGDDRLVLFTTAGFQKPEAQDDPYHLHLARRVPELLVSYLARLGSRITLLHVGPAPLPGAATLASYRHERQLPPDEFQGAVAAADLLLTLNVCATTIVSAIRHDVPSLVVVNSRTARPGELPERHRAVAPLLPFKIWPIGLANLVTAALRANPYVDAIDQAELLDEETVIATCERLVFDRTARDDAAHRRRRYRDRVQALPRAADVFEEVLRR